MGKFSNQMLSLKKKKVSGVRFHSSYNFDDIQDVTKVKKKSHKTFKEKFEKTPLIEAFISYVNFITLIAFGFLREFLQKCGIEKVLSSREDPEMEEFVPLYSSFESFYSRNIVTRVQDIFNRPICCPPGANIDLVERRFSNSGLTYSYTGNVIKDVVNLGSFNYLGFAENKGTCAKATIDCVRKYGVGVCSSRQEVGTLDLHEKLEDAMAKYLDVEACITFETGNSTNALNIPCLVRKGCLILSDSLNHASLVLGCRLSGATIHVFNHNDMKDLENKLSNAVVNGQPLTHRPWKKILIVVEGIYSMEGSMVNLPGVLALKKNYKAYLYVDEAHSIGAVGERGRGVTEYFGIHPREVDVLMGTFSKSFGAAGGFIAGTRAIVKHLKMHSHSACYAVSMSPPVCQQILTSLNIIAHTDDGKKRIQQLARNTKIFRKGLQRIGNIVYGNDDSPVVPLLIYSPSKLAAFSREMLGRGFAVVCVGFPATSMKGLRARICMSSVLTENQIQKALQAISEISDLLQLKNSK